MMRNISFVYRILLPPLFLFSLCLPRPPELEQGRPPGQDSHKSDDPERRTPGGFKTMYQHIVTPNKTNEKGVSVVSSHVALGTERVNISPDTHRSPLEAPRGRATNVHNGVSQISDTAGEKFTNGILQSFSALSRHVISHRAQITPPGSSPLRSDERRTFNLPHMVRNSKSSSTIQSFLTYRNGKPVTSRIRPYFEQSNTFSTIKRRRPANRVRRSVTPYKSRRHHKSRPGKTSPPEYMLHLYKLFAGTHYAALRGTLITSFVNILDQDTEWTDESRTSRSRLLAFDFFISEDKEIIQHAELRIYVHPFIIGRKESEADQSVTETVDNCTVVIYELAAKDEQRLMGRKSLSSSQREWLSVNVTSAVESWPTSGLQMLEVRFQSAGKASVLDVDIEHGKDPLLIIFSKKRGSNKIHPKRRKKREVGGAGFADPIWTKFGDKSYAPFGQYKDSVPTEIDHYLYSYINAAIDTSLESPNNLTNYPMDMLMNFLGSENPSHASDTLYEDDGSLNTKAGDSTFLPLEALTRSQENVSLGNQPMTLSANGRQKATERPFPQTYQLAQDNWYSSGISLSQSADYDRIQMPENSMRLRVRRETKARYRRHLDSLFKNRKRKTKRSKRSRRGRNSCRRARMKVDFQAIKFNVAIAAPLSYQAFRCTGNCYFPIADKLSPTNHAIIQTLMYVSRPDFASRACCVPTKLDSIHVIYMSEKGNFVFDPDYEGMVVAECGCR